MKLKALVVIILLAGISVFLWSRFSDSSPSMAPAEGSRIELDVNEMFLPPASMEEDVAITNYDECIAAGNSPLPDASDKCLTKDGHIFIEGVIEEIETEEP
ncbi:MAG: hypothetical protein Q7S52_00945 [bacterium]|nr:hypothetical protein [bacterium]